MKKIPRLFSLLLFFVLVVIPVFALPKGPTEKATGSIEIFQEELPDRREYFEFEAYEEQSDKPALGWMHYWDIDISNGALVREYNWDIMFVKIDGDFAWFAGICTYAKTRPFRLGQFLVVKVHDMGSPGDKFDEVVWGCARAI